MSLVSYTKNTNDQMYNVHISAIQYSVSASEQCKLELYNVLTSKTSTPNSPTHSHQSVQSPTSPKKGASPPAKSEDDKVVDDASNETSSEPKQDIVAKDVEPVAECVTKERTSVNEILDSADATLQTVAARFSAAMKIKDEHFLRVQSAVSERINKRRGIDPQANMVCEQYITILIEYL